MIIRMIIQTITILILSIMPIIHDSTNNHMYMYILYKVMCVRCVECAPETFVMDYEGTGLAPARFGFRVSGLRA